MSKNLPQIFDYQHKKIRTVMVGGELWFVAPDVCKILGLRTSEAVKGKKIRNYEDGISKDDYREGVDTVDTLGGNQKVITVSEGGLYDLIFKSHKPEAKPFKRWVTHELIPTIRKTGAYITDRADPAVLREKANEISKIPDITGIVQYLIPAYEAAGMKPQFRLLALRQLYQKANLDIPVGDMTFDKELFDTEQIAAKLGVYSINGKPHGQAALAIIRQVEVLPEERELVPYTRNGHSGTTYQYTANVTEKARKWLMENGYPTSIESATSKAKRIYSVAYKTVGARQ